MTAARPTKQHTQALREMRRLVADPAKPLLAAEHVGTTPAGVHVRLTMPTGTLPLDAPGGLPIRHPAEDVVLTLGPDWPWTPPYAHVEHIRFAGHPHVLLGHALCLYLDPSQEWHPAHGVVGALNRLSAWLDDAAHGRFDARLALYHPVGGVLHRHPGAPTVVARHDPPPGRPFARAWLVRRTNRRLDLAPGRVDGAVAALVAYPPQPLWFGAGLTVAGLCGALEQAGGPNPAGLLSMLAWTAAANPDCTPAYFLLSVPGAPNASGPGHLLCGRLSPVIADALRRAARVPGPMVTVDPTGPLSAVPIEWCAVSEERHSRTTRRDDRRPVSAFVGADVALWGCGGLGSWAGELIARAGARRILLCDPSPVTGGLLVRQDYVESDIGTAKADALADRLRALRDDLIVQVEDRPYAFLARQSLPPCQVFVDATVSTAVAAALHAVWATTQNAPLVARLVTDRATSTLGMLAVTRPGAGPDPETADEHAGQAVARDPALQPFACLWEPVGPDDELVAVPGCSVPTYHGSAADLAAITGSLISLLGPHLRATDNVTGTHLIALPHSSTGAVGHHWLP